MMVVQNFVHVLYNSTAVFLDVVSRVLITNTLRRREHQQRQQKQPGRHSDSDFWHTADINGIVFNSARKFVARVL